ncbi:MAG TPA: hypothetical protein VGT40_11040 [Methylomirabilota bacterium]|nr:hypothetical protein [Methylomirabilota bacterium]
MRRFLFLSLLLVVSFDLSTPDAAPGVPAARAIEWGDEEESVPSRRQRTAAEDRRVSPPTPGRRLIEPLPPGGDTERTWYAAHPPSRPTARLVPIRQAPSPPARSPSPPEDH